MAASSILAIYVQALLGGCAERPEPVSDPPFTTIPSVMRKTYRRSRQLFFTQSAISRTTARRSTFSRQSSTLDILESRSTSMSGSCAGHFYTLRSDVLCKSCRGLSRTAGLSGSAGHAVQRTAQVVSQRVIERFKFPVGILKVFSPRCQACVHSRDFLLCLPTLRDVSQGGNEVRGLAGMIPHQGRMQIHPDDGAALLDVPLIHGMAGNIADAQAACIDQMRSRYRLDD